MYVVCCNNVYILQVCQCWGERSVCDGHVDSAGSMAGCHSNPTGLEQALAGKTLSLSLSLLYITRSLIHSHTHPGVAHPLCLWGSDGECVGQLLLSSCSAVLSLPTPTEPPVPMAQTAAQETLHLTHTHTHTIHVRCRVGMKALTKSFQCQSLIVQLPYAVHT